MMCPSGAPPPAAADAAPRMAAITPGGIRQVASNRRSRRGDAMLNLLGEGISQESVREMSTRTPMQIADISGQIADISGLSRARANARSPTFPALRPYVR